MREVRCRNCGTVTELPEYHGAVLIVCPQCEWHETHPPRRPLAETMEGQANTAYRAHQERLRAAGARLDRVRGFPPRLFARFCGELFEQSGYEVLPADNEAYALELRRGEEVVYVACDRRTEEETIEPAELETLAAALGHDNVDRGIFVTLGTFAEPCDRMATRADIELMDGAGLQYKVAFADAERLDGWLAEHEA